MQALNVCVDSLGILSDNTFSMSQIRVLPDQTANQIAAGEVVERPAAVVKELLENSLDSGASRVEVVFRNGGMSYLKISDNGSGMSEEEALLSLERHATSKLRQIDDLRSIMSYGFRGEAIPSIASVSRFLLRTRRAEDQLGTEILVLGGKIQHVRECGIPPGTIIEVDRLFYNVPARRKFLKKEITETAHIAHLLKLYSLACPQTSFTLKEDKRVMLFSAPCPTLNDRIGELFGRDITEHLRPIAKSAEDLRIVGLAGTPALQRATRQDILFFVNNRPVDSRLLNLAAMDAYRTLLPRGRFPFVIANLDIPPASVDVNVHPTKREVRFRQEGTIRKLVIDSLWELLNIQFHQEHTDLVSIPELTVIPNTNPSVASEHVHLQPPVAAPDKVAHPLKQESDITPHTPPVYPEATPAPPPATTGITPPTVTAPRPTFPSPKSTDNTQSATSSVRIPLPPKTPETTPTRETSFSPLLQQLPRWQFLGKLSRGLLLFSHPQGLTLVHCRAAQQRIDFEKTLSQLEQGQLPSQTLVFPISLELNAHENRLLKESLELFSEIGVQIEEFGKSWYRIASIPAMVDQHQAEHLVRQVLAWLDTTSSSQQASQEGRIWIATQLANYHARDTLPESADSAFSLVRELLSCRSPMISPNGNPTLVEITMGELQRRFFPQSRTQSDWDD